MTNTLGMLRYTVIDVVVVVVVVVVVGLLICL